VAAGTRVPLAEAAALADELVELLAPVCDRLVVAGSIRRQRPDVGDIELLAVPLLQPRLDLFGEDASAPPVSRLDALCDDLISRGTLSTRLDVHGRGAYGAKYKRLRYRDLPLDLFSATPDNFGLLLVIRTGPAAYSRRLVTERRYGGWMPSGCRVKDGFLWRDGDKVPVPTEADLYALLGRPFDAPQVRRDP